MMNDSSNTIQVTEASELEYPPPARFDENASANAQPVEPIPTNRAARWMGRARAAGLALGTKTKVLGLVLVGALAIGAAGGAFLVRDTASSSAKSRVVAEPAGDVSAIEVPQSTDESRTASATRLNSPSADQIKPRTRESRKRVPRQRPRARLVGVIK
jgi:hypothetical protein